MAAIAGKVMPRPRGLYDENALYDILDVVNYKNKLWIAKKPNLQGVEPSELDTDNWMLAIDSKGEDIQALEASIDERFLQVSEQFTSVTEDISELRTSVTEDITELQTFVASNNKQIDELQNEKADKSTVVNTTILASKWTGNSLPYTNTLTVEGVTESNIVDVVLPNTLTGDEITAYQEAQILNGTQANGSITLNSWGIVPLINLPVTVIIRG